MSGGKLIRNDCKQAGLVRHYVVTLSIVLWDAKQHAGQEGKPLEDCKITPAVKCILLYCLQDFLLQY